MKSTSDPAKRQVKKRINSSVCNRWGKVHTEAIRRVQGNASAIAVYSTLATFSDGNGDCFPTQETLSELCGLSRRTVQAALKLLQTNNAIEAKRQRNKKTGKQAATSYKLLFYSEQNDKINTNVEAKKRVYFVQMLQVTGRRICALKTNYRAQILRLQGAEYALCNDLDYSLINRPINRRVCWLFFTEALQLTRIKKMGRLKREPAEGKNKLNPNDSINKKIASDFQEVLKKHKICLHGTNPRSWHNQINKLHCEGANYDDLRLVVEFLDHEWEKKYTPKPKSGHKFYQKYAQCFEHAKKWDAERTAPVVEIPGRAFELRTKFFDKTDWPNNWETIPEAIFAARTWFRETRKRLIAVEGDLTPGVREAKTFLAGCKTSWTFARLWVASQQWTEKYHKDIPPPDKISDLEEYATFRKREKMALWGEWRSFQKSLEKLDRLADE